MKYFFLTMLLLLSNPFVVSANYSASDYQPEYLPYNLEDAIEWDECQNELEDFDEQYRLYLNQYLNARNAGGGTVSGAQAEMNNALNKLEVNRIAFGEIFNSCIKKGEEVEEERESEEIAQRFEQQRLDRLQRALDECDFNYFEKMSVEEKMDTYDERKACEDKKRPQEQTIDITQPTLQTTYVEPTTYVPIKPSATQYREPVKEALDENLQIQEGESGEFVNSTTSESTTTKDVLEVTQEELDRLVEEKLQQKISENESEPESEQKPSFFKRITNFLFGWLL